MTDTLEIGKQRAEELGLKTLQLFRYYNGPGSGQDLTFFYEADDIHKLLGEGVERNVECIFSKDKLVPVKINDSAGPDKAKYKALLIGIRPIKEESEERKWLRAFYEAAKKMLGEVE